MKGKVKILFVLSLLPLFTCCYYDSAEDLYPGVNLDVLNDTTNVTFNGTVKPLLETFCFQCHGNSTASTKGKNIYLENYSDIKSAADDGSLYGSVSWAPYYTRMPKDANKLPDIKIAQLKRWIDSGAPND
jgi:hypothetical protein